MPGTHPEAAADPPEVEPPATASAPRSTTARAPDSLATTTITGPPTATSVTRTHSRRHRPRRYRSSTSDSTSARLPIRVTRTPLAFRTKAPARVKSSRSPTWPDGSHGASTAPADAPVTNDSDAPSLWS